MLQNFNQSPPYSSTHSFLIKHLLFSFSIIFRLHFYARSAVETMIKDKTVFQRFFLRFSSAIPIFFFFEFVVCATPNNAIKKETLETSDNISNFQQHQQQICVETTKYRAIRETKQRNIKETKKERKKCLSQRKKAKVLCIVASFF